MRKLARWLVWGGIRQSYAQPPPPSIREREEGRQHPEVTNTLPVGVDCKVVVVLFSRPGITRQTTTDNYTDEIEKKTYWLFHENVIYIQKQAS